MADLSEVSAEALTEVMGWVKEAKEFATEQAPLLAQEIVTYGRVSSGLGFLLGLGLIATCVVCCSRLVKHRAKWNEDVDVRLPIYAGVAIASGIISIPAIIESAFPLMQSMFAPRLYVIEKLSGLLK